MDKKHLIYYVNADCMLISFKDKEYCSILNKADCVYSDGAGVVLGARIMGKSIPKRSTAADFMPRFCEVFAEYGFRIFLLGAKMGVAEEAAEKLVKRIPHLKIAGTHHGYFNKEDTGGVIAKINSVKPDLLLVGFGAPIQEKWIYRNINSLDVSVAWGVGGLFDFISGRTWRGPSWLLDNGFEWLCRLIAEPKRLWYRYLVGNARFVFSVLNRRFAGKDLVQ